MFMFCFTPEQTAKNKLNNCRALAFIMESLSDLDRELQEHGHKLHIFYDNVTTLLPRLCKEYGVTEVIAGADYSPYSKQRDRVATTNLARVGVPLTLVENNLLLKVGVIRTGDDATYVKFTPFYNKGLTHKVPKIKQLCINKSMRAVNVQCESLSAMYDKLLPGFKRNDISLIGGRAAGLSQIKTKIGGDNATKMSAYINRGCISARELYWHLRTNVEKQRQLWWREFYINLVYAQPALLSHDVAQRTPVKYSKVWSLAMTDAQQRLFAAWCNGRTGYPLIDCSMQEMNETGYMHNRGRMMCAEFLCKRLFIHWQYGEQYFATKLIDYDAIANTCNWIWVACIQPYFRVFNPEHAESHYAEHIGNRLVKYKAVPKIPILSEEEIIKRYRAKW
jgi:deoxyribodipyrimidine photo-lyase